MEKLSFIEVRGGALVASSNITTLLVDTYSDGGHAVTILTKGGRQWVYTVCENEDKAFKKMHELAETLGAEVVSADEGDEGK